MNRLKEWEEVYKHHEFEELPWYNPDLDLDFKRIIEELGLKEGRVLDVGSGPGTQAMRLSDMGFDVTATDISKSAVMQASREASKKGSNVRFIQDDILNSNLTESFDYIFDRGLFHVIEPAKRQLYVNNIRKLLVPKGYLFLKCFSDKEPGTQGPYRISSQDIRDNFGDDFDVISISDSTFDVSRKPHPRALFCVVKNK